MLPRIAIPTVRSRFALAALGCALAWGLAGCGSQTSLTNMWRDPTFSSPPMTKVLVIAVKRDPAMRRIWEDGMTQEMREHGVKAVPSYQLFPGDLPDTQQVIEGVRSQGFDGVVLTHSLGTEVSQHYVPGYVTSAPAMGYDPWYGVYYTYYHHIYEPGYVETERVARYETEVYTAGYNGRLVWTGTTESLDPHSSVSVNRQISDKIVPELVRVGVLAGRKT